MMGTKARNFQPLPEDISLEDLVPQDSFYRLLQEKFDLTSCLSADVGVRWVGLTVARRATSSVVACAQDLRRLFQICRMYSKFVPDSFEIHRQPLLCLPGKGR
jgi:hypothetical protein